MEFRTDKSPSSFLIGALILTIGALFLLQNFDVLDFGNVVAHWWPLIMVIVGLDRLRKGDRSGGTILLIVGVAFLTATLDIIRWGSIFRFWPVVLILVGLSILLRGRNRSGWLSATAGETSEDYLKIRSTFSGVRRSVSSENFKGGEISAVFGSAELDLRNAKASVEGCRLDLSAQFGAVELIVPADWRVSVSGSPLLGAIEDKTAKTGENPVHVECRCSVAFGAIEIHN
ncbi:LiaI-LiaF-like domain-containing protein [Candidatus Neomarinimicrobiota bacterium]